MENKILLTVLFLVISGFLIFFLVLPKYQDLALLKNRVAQKKAEFESMERYFANLTEVAEKLKSYQDKIDKIDSALPDKISLPDFLNFVQKVSSESGLSFKEIESFMTKERKEEKIEETNIVLILTGYYPDLKNFLSVLENSARLIEVEGVSFANGKDGVFDFRVSTKIYSY